MVFWLEICDGYLFLYASLNIPEIFFSVEPYSDCHRLRVNFKMLRKLYKVWRCMIIIG